jgi:hypothetical protein
MDWLRDITCVFQGSSQKHPLRFESPCKMIGIRRVRPLEWPASLDTQSSFTTVRLLEFKRGKDSRVVQVNGRDRGIACGPEERGKHHQRASASAIRSPLAPDRQAHRRPGQSNGRIQMLSSRVRPECGQGNAAGYCPGQQTTFGSGPPRVQRHGRGNDHQYQREKNILPQDPPVDNAIIGHRIEEQHGEESEAETAIPDQRAERPHHGATGTRIEQYCARKSGIRSR